MPLKWDLQNENFDYFFLEQSMQMSERQKELLPPSLLYKIFTKGNRINSKSTSKLSFIEKIFVLVRSLNKRWVLLVEDDTNGLSVEDFFKYKESTKKRNYTSVDAENLSSEGEFVLGSSELLDTFQKLNCLSVSPAYNYLLSAKNKDYTKPQKWSVGMKGIVRFLSQYEANRKKITLQTGLTMADWLVLIYLYHGNLVTGSPIYKEWYKYSFNSSQAKIRAAFTTLQRRSYVEKTGNTNGAKIQITALGRDKINEVMKKFVLI